MSDIERGQLIVGRGINQDHISVLSSADIESLPDSRYKVKVRLSSWERGKTVKGPPILAATFAYKDSKGGILVYDPYRQAVLDLDEQAIQRLSEDGGDLNQVALWMAGSAVAKHVSETQPDRVEVVDLSLDEESSRFNRFEEPKEHEFSLNNEKRVGLHHVGDLEFEFTILVKNL